MHPYVYAGLTRASRLEYCQRMAPQPARKDDAWLACRLEQLCDNAGYTVAEVVAHNRKRPMAEIRQVMMYALYQDGCTLKAIGRIMGRDHATVRHARMVIEDAIVTRDRVIADIWRRVMRSELPTNI